MHAPESVIPIPNAKAARASGQLTGEMWAPAGSESEVVSGRNCPKITLYPIAPVAIAKSTETNGVEFFSSIPSRNMQKKQNLPLSNNRPRDAPINNEIGAVLA